MTQPSALPLTPLRAQEVIDLARQSRHDWTASNYRIHLSGAEVQAVTDYWRNHTPAFWCFNDVVRHCAKQEVTYRSVSEEPYRYRNEDGERVVDLERRSQALAAYAQSRNAISTRVAA